MAGGGGYRILVGWEQDRVGQWGERSGRTGTEGCGAAWDKANPGMIFPLQWSMWRALCRGGYGLTFRLGFVENNWWCITNGFAKSWCKFFPNCLYTKSSFDKCDLDQVVYISEKKYRWEPSLRSVSVFRGSSWLHMCFCRDWLFKVKHQDRGLACEPTLQLAFSSLISSWKAL